MGKSLIIPGADFSDNCLPILSIVTKNNVPFYVYYGSNIQDTGGNNVVGVEGVVEVNGSYELSLLPSPICLIFGAKQVYDVESESFVDIHYYNNDRSIDYGVLYPNSVDVLESISIGDISLNEAARLLTGNTGIRYADMRHINVDGATSLRAAFANNTGLIEVKMPKRTVDTPLNCQNLFISCTSLESVDFSDFNVKGINNFNWGFKYCESLKSIDFSGLDFGIGRQKLNEFFRSNDSLVSAKLGNLISEDTTQVNMMFKGDGELLEVDMSDCDFKNVQIVKDMFHFCYKLTSLNVGTWDLGSVTDYTGWFSSCNSLTSITGTIVNFGKSATANIGLGNATHWDHDSLMKFINGLYDRTGMSSLSIIMLSDCLSSLSAEEIQIATNKNWTIITY